MSYYEIGATFPATISTRLSNLASRAKKEVLGLKRQAESHIQTKAKEGALSATPAIRAEVRKEVTPYIIGATAVGVAALLLAMRK